MGKLITKEIERKPRANAGAEGDPKPVLKVFNPYGAATWLFTELDESGRLFGLCDLGAGSPELGYVDLAELESVRVFGGRLPLERDRWFTADKPLSGYADAARAAGRIVA